jgi:hypothetical protein
MAGDRQVGRRPRFITRVSFLVGVAASVVANVLAAPDDPLSRSISAWPAVGLLLVVEMITGERQPVPTIVGKLPDRTDNHVDQADEDDAEPGASSLVADLPQDAGNLPAVLVTGNSYADRVVFAAARLPATASLAEIAAAAGCSERTAGRYLAADHPAKPGNGRTPGAGNGRPVATTSTT